MGTDDTILELRTRLAEAVEALRRQESHSAQSAAENEAMLRAECQHRVRNIMAVTQQLIARSALNSANVDEYEQHLRGRLKVFVCLQTLFSRSAPAGISVRELLDAQMSAQAVPKSRYDLRGSFVTLSPKAAEVFMLAVHELVGNALKYGALLVANGRVHLRWKVVFKDAFPWLVFDWRELLEHDNARVSNPQGFGTEVIEARVHYELGGCGRLMIEPNRVRCHLEFPLRDAPSFWAIPNAS